MTIDFLRARLLSERSVSRAAKERGDHLARRVAELEEQLRTVTAQRRKAERAAAEVLAILDSQGFGRLSDAADDDSGSEEEVDTDTGDPAAAERDQRGGNAAEDALSGSELGALAAAARAAGGLSWRGRAASPDWERRRPPPPPLQQRGRQLRQRHGHGHRRGYFYSRASDSSPKYHPGQSCRKIKRKELRSQTEGEEGGDNAAESTEDGQERSDCTVCTDEQPGFDGEASPDGCGSGNGGLEDGNADYPYARVYEKEGEMERVLEKQAKLIGQFEAEENAQREWEKKFSKCQVSTMDNANLNNKLNEAENVCGSRETAQIVDKEVVCEQATSSENNLYGINSPSEYVPKCSGSELPPNVAKDNVIEQCKVDGSDHDFGLITNVTVASSHGELQVRKDVLTTQSYPEGSGTNVRKSTPPPPGSFDSSLNAGHNKGQGDENSDSGSSYNTIAHSSERYINASSVGSPLSDTPKSEVSEWSSSCFHNHTDNQLDTQPRQLSSDVVGGVLEALQHAKMSLRAKLNQPSPPSQNILALPAPDDLPVNDMQLSLSMLASHSQEISALPTADYRNRVLLRDNIKVPVGPAGLFRLPTDLFPRNEMVPSVGYGSRFSLTSTSSPYISSSYHANHVMPNRSFSQYGSGLSMDQCHDPHSSMLSSLTTDGWHSFTVSEFITGNGSFLPEVPRPGNDFRRGMMPSGDVDTHFYHGRG